MGFFEPPKRRVLILVASLFTWISILLLSSLQSSAAKSLQQTSAEQTATSIKLTVQAALTPSLTPTADTTLTVVAIETMIQQRVDTALTAAAPTLTSTPSYTPTPEPTATSTLTSSLTIVTPDYDATNAAIATAIQRAVMATVTASNPVAIDNPTIMVDFDSDGQTRIDGLPVDDLVATSVLGEEWYRLKPISYDIQSAIDNNIQHIQVRNPMSGLEVLINGQAIPSIIWNPESLALTYKVLGLLGTNDNDRIYSILKFAQNLNSNIVFKFPLSSGSESIPLKVSGTDSVALSASSFQNAFLQQAGSVAHINVPINYNMDGTYNIGSLSARSLMRDLGLPTDFLEADQETITRFIDGGIKTFTLMTSSDGISMTLNGEELPYINWSDGKLIYAFKLTYISQGEYDATLGNSPTVTTHHSDSRSECKGNISTPSPCNCLCQLNSRSYTQIRMKTGVLRSMW